jgi:cyclohexanone monooxygenase
MDQASKHVDAVVVGAGFGGMYMSHLLRGKGYDVQGFERGSGVGGTWFWNRYPGCRCDVESMEYSYQFSDDLQQEWEWSERYSAQPEILAYAEHVAERFDIASMFQFNTSVTAASYDQQNHTWRVQTDQGDELETQYLIMATGCLSTANMPDIPGIHDFKGETYHTGAWPPEGVDFSDKRVAVIGTGSSAIQSIPHIAQQAEQLTVFQRTPNYSIPAQNAPIDHARVAQIKANYDNFRTRNKMQPAAFGADYPRNPDSVLEATPGQRQQRFEEHWNYGGFMFMGAFGDLSLDPEANEYAAEFVRSKIRSIVEDPATAELLCPKTVIGCKRLCADTGYFETYNRKNVSLVDVSEHPITQITEQGLITGGREYGFDAIVFATGFDAMTGTLLNIDIRGENGVTLQEKWAAGPRTYLGLMTAQFPNLFMMTGPGSPSVLANMITGVEQHADYIADLLDWTQANGVTEIKPEVAAEDEWVDVVNMRSQATLYPRCNSWYLGANIPGKPRVFMPYLGFPDYVETLREIQSAGYKGFLATA